MDSKKTQAELFKQFFEKRKAENMKKVKQAMDEEKLITKPEKDQIKNYQRNYKKQTQGRVLLRQLKYQMSPQGRVSSAITKGFSFVQSPTKHLYNIGRPKGSYENKYKSYGGVYEFRKEQALKRKIKRMEYERKLKINPYQQAILNQVAARQQANKINPENQIIPDTNGMFNFDSITREINDASNAYS